MDISDVDIAQTFVLIGGIGGLWYKIIRWQVNTERDIKSLDERTSNLRTKDSSISEKLDNINTEIHKMSERLLELEVLMRKEKT